MPGALWVLELRFYLFCLLFDRVYFSRIICIRISSVFYVDFYPFSLGSERKCRSTKWTWTEIERIGKTIKVWQRRIARTGQKYILFSDSLCLKLKKPYWRYLENGYWPKLVGKHILVIYCLFSFLIVRYWRNRTSFWVFIISSHVPYP